MSPIKRLLRSRTAQACLTALVAGYIRFIRLTTPWEVVRHEVVGDMRAAGQPFIVAFWHGRMLMMAPMWPRGMAFHMLISQHRDGELIAEVMHRLGIGTVRGSTSRGGTGALRAMLRALSAGECVGITPDGPAGPRQRASDGIVTVARLSGAPIVPCAYSTRRRKVLGSWDRFVIAFPFGRGVHVWGEPIHVARDADAATLEAARMAVEDSLNACVRMADARFGQTPTEPDPLPEALADVLADCHPDCLPASGPPGGGAR